MTAPYPAEHVRNTIDELDQGLSELEENGEYIGNVLWFQNWIDQLSDRELEMFGARFDDHTRVDWKREGF